MQEKEQKISPIKQRILQFADSLGISKRVFYAQIGVSRGTLEAKTGITEDIMAKFIAAYPEVSINWLVTGNGEIFTTKTPKNVTLSKGDILGDGKGDKPKLQKTSPFTEYPTGEASFEKNVADVAVDKVFKLRTDRLIDRQQIPNGISEENLLRFLSYYNDVNPIWLLTGEGEILLTKTPKNVTFY